MHELGGKRVEVKPATPKGSGSMAARGQAGARGRPASFAGGRGPPGRQPFAQPPGAPPYGFGMYGYGAGGVLVRGACLRAALGCAGPRAPARWPPGASTRLHMHLDRAPGRGR
jgi:hypothetical protein